MTTTSPPGGVRPLPPGATPRSSPAALKLLASLAILALAGCASEPPAVAQTCLVNAKAWPVCAKGDGWGFEEGRYCIARSFCPDARSTLPAGPGRDTPVDAQATPATRGLFSYLRGTWGKSILSGQSDLTWQDAIDMAERVHADTGKYPALMGYDFMNYGMPAGSASGLRQTEEAIAWARRGGLVTFTWHWRDPALLRTPSVSKANFYVRDDNPEKNTTFTIPVARGALDRASPAMRQIDDGIDLVAAELKKLASAGVPVLWRPLHEASGKDGDGWFWWGRTRTDGVPQAYASILLWRHMYDRLVNVHGIHNLVWVWNGQDPAWYPGDDVVDIISQDIYDEADNKTYGAQLPAYLQARRTTADSKPVALSENGYIPDPDKIAAEGAWWLWFMTWNDRDTPAGVTAKENFWTGEYYNTDAHKRKVYHHPLVITLDRLPREVAGRPGQAAADGVPAR
ncbi:glycosyl hydrolase [Pseudoduganella umbonata]|uniref:Beta-mannosidase n=1 Tax=Pseudoduganella umbonata TaxID=864828 RepID=A0A4V1EDF0_9BURK|nr:glycosyl hydrolase [Pseudoduganella umbonata]MBB3222642.1 mannan endo-1,4-beta-mannosidase [Pseudoduganella umbonata]QCP10851.1 beta-mannosidase [Pseudoduganella umbonata]